MWSYQYKHGDRPLEGYTIQRAAGRGGFGEVYYALSDSGREVALKVVTGYEQIELRGISQCMNLKDPHLVSIFDVKHNALGRPFVIMEYVSGPSLRELLDANPSGLGEQKAAFFLREIAKGLTFLHDCGIVHRDLKPGNIFYENGYVKIGDYGLSKAISTTQHSGQTVTVGTVHYMAPEVGAGKYDRGIDIYAMGAVLYEMLTGVPPFVGASPSEVLLKHLSATPDCTGINEPFTTTIKKAMAKDPNERYQSVQEMVEAVFGAEHVQQSMSVFSPQELSMVAGRVAKHVAVAAAGAAVAGGGSDKPAAPTVTVEPPPRRFDQIDDRMGRRADLLGGMPDPSRDMSVPLEDPLPRRSRIAITLGTIAIFAVAAEILTSSLGLAREPGRVGIFVALAIGGAVFGLTSVRRALVPKIAEESRGLRWLVTAGIAAVFMFPLAAMVGNGSRTLGSSGLWIAMIGSILIADIERWTRPQRRERVQLGHAMGAGMIAFILSMIFHGTAPIAVAVAAGTALAVQALSPWDSRRVVGAVGTVGFNAAGASPPVPPSQQIAKPQTDAAPGGGPVAAPATPIAPLVPTARYSGWPVPAAIRFIWLGFFALFISLSIALLVAAGNETRAPEVPASFGMAFGVLALLSLVRGLSAQHYGVWHYLIRPLLMTLAVATGVVSAIVAGNSRLHSEEIAVATFFIVFPGILLIVLMFIPGKRYKLLADAPPVMPDAHSNVSPYKRSWALLLSAFAGIGVAGIQRFYVGKVFTGIIWLLTWGLCGVGQVLDIIRILTGKFTDARGRRLIVWEDPNEVFDDSVVRHHGAALSAAAPPPLPMPPVAVQRPVLQAPSQPGQQRAHANGLLSALAGLLLFISMILGVVVALDLPTAVSKGVFDQGFATEIQRDMFNGYENWPALANRLAFMLAALTVLMGVAVLVVARRRSGGLQQVLSFVGAGGLMLALMVLSKAFNVSYAWQALREKIDVGQPAAALDVFLDSWQPGGVMLAAGIFIVSLVVLARPASSSFRKAG